MASQAISNGKGGTGAGVIKKNGIWETVVLVVSTTIDCSTELALLIKKNGKRANHIR
jgi:hypothetical protein